jgi:hypothetical protein
MEMRVMKHIAVLSVVVGSLVLATACTTATPPARSLGGVVGSGITSTEVRSVAGYSEVVVNGIGEVTLRQDGTERLSVEAEDNLLPLLQSTVRGRQLVLGPGPGVALHPTRAIRYTLSIRDVQAIQMNGAGSLRADDVHAERLQTTLNGGARVELTGTAETQDLLIAGAAEYRAASLTSRAASVEINGAGTVIVNVSDRLDATINGAGTVEYIGTPRVSQSINGFGSVRRRI